MNHGLLEYSQALQNDTVERPGRRLAGVVYQPPFHEVKMDNIVEPDKRVVDDEVLANGERQCILISTYIRLQPCLLSEAVPSSIDLSNRSTSPSDLPHPWIRLEVQPIDYGCNQSNNDGEYSFLCFWTQPPAKKLWIEPLEYPD